MYDEIKDERCHMCARWTRCSMVKHSEVGTCERTSKTKRANQKACAKFKPRVVTLDSEAMLHKDEPIVFRDTEFERHKAFKEFQQGIEKILDGRFSNADSIRNLEDDFQLALRLWNLPKFETFEEMHEWLQKEHVFEKDNGWLK